MTTVALVVLVDISVNRRVVRILVWANRPWTKSLVPPRFPVRKVVVVVCTAPNPLPFWSWS